MESAADNFPVCITARATRIRAGAPQRFSYLLCWMVVLVVFVAYAGDAVAETPSEATRRHEQIAQRRTGIDIICHRGTSEFAHENTLEAYRATFELGGDGNEIDIRSTRDGELIVFHDDTLDQLLEAFGDVSDFSLDELRQFRFRIPGPFGQQCRIPTLTEVFELHHRYAGLMHLDIKRPGLDGAIADLLTRMDMWDHVAYCNEENSGVILCDARLKLRRYKAPGLYIDHSDVFPNAVAEALKRPGDGIIVDDPRAVALVLGRTFGELSRHPVSRSSVVERVEDKKPISEAGLIMILRDADDWNRVAETTAEKAASGGRITARARAAEQLGVRQASTAEAFAVLEERVRNRSFHKDWKFHGLDGEFAARCPESPASIGRYHRPRRCPLHGMRGFRTALSQQPSAPQTVTLPTALRHIETTVPRSQSPIRAIRFHRNRPAEWPSTSAVQIDRRTPSRSGVLTLQTLKTGHFSQWKSGEDLDNPEQSSSRSRYSLCANSLTGVRNQLTLFSSSSARGKRMLFSRWMC